MEEQLAFARLLKESGQGIALCRPTQDVDVGDVCYWDSNGTATRILNVFENREWLVEKKWPKFEVKKEQAVKDLSGDAKLQPAFGQGCSWGAAPVYSTMPLSLDVFFQRTATEAAIILPSSPITVTGLQTEKPLQEWWAKAKRHAFRTWPYLINNPNGIFLVTRTVKTKRYARCLSKGNVGQWSQIRITGKDVAQGETKVALSAEGTQWMSIHNDLGLEIEDSGGKAMYTVFIERAATRMFALTEPDLRSEAEKLWSSSCLLSAAGILPPAGSSKPLPRPSFQQQGLPIWVQELAPSQNPFALGLQNYWQAAGTASPPYILPGPFAASPAQLSKTNLAGNKAQVQKDASASAVDKGTGAPSLPKFDGNDRLCLSDDWYLIRGDNAFFMELSGIGADVLPGSITVQFLQRLLKEANAKLAASIAANSPDTSAYMSLLPGVVQSAPYTAWNMVPMAGVLAGAQQMPFNSTMAPSAMINTFANGAHFPMSIAPAMATSALNIGAPSSVAGGRFAGSTASAVAPQFAFEIPWGWLF